MLIGWGRCLFVPSLRAENIVEHDPVWAGDVIQSYLSIPHSAFRTDPLIC